MKTPTLRARAAAWMRSSAWRCRPTHVVLVDATLSRIWRSVVEPELPLARHPSTAEAADCSLAAVRVPVRPRSIRLVVAVLASRFDSEAADFEVRVPGVHRSV